VHEIVKARLNESQEIQIMSDNKHKDVFENAPVGIYRSTVDGRLAEANPALARMFGYDSPAHMIANVTDLAVQLFVDPAKRGEVVERAVKNGGFVEEEVKYRRRDGKAIDALLRMRAIRGGSGEVETLEGFLEDITGERETERTLSQANELNALLVRSIPFGISIVDSSGVILYCNDEMRRLAGADLTGKRCWEVYRDDGRKCEDCPPTRETRPGEKRTIELSGLFGGRSFQITQSGLTYNGGDALLEVFEDITEKKKLQTELAQIQKLQSIGTLASGIAHDFNNLLGIILGNAALIERSGDDRDRSLKRIRTISEAAERGTSLVKQMLMFARNSEPSFSAVPMNRVVGDVVKLLYETFPKSIRLLCNLTEDLPAVNGDPTQIHQVLLNLCVNARDAMNPSGDLIISTETVSAETVHKLFPTASSPEYVLVGVSDNGTGMPRDVLEHIFEPFFTTKGPAKGTGLGLSVVFGIMQEHRGFVDVTSEPGKGTSFALYFPVYPHQDSAAAVEESAEDDIPGGSETILVVEDEEMLNELITSMLSAKGYTVLRSSDGKEAVEVYGKNKERVALVISDFGLPKLSGGEVLTWLKEINPEVRFMLATGYIDPEERAAIIENGAKEIVLKPYRPADLLKKVRKVLDMA
jgi:PAS domain S-box-containing protein